METLRVRWYSLPISRPDVRKLGGALPNVAYTDKRGHGFLLNEVRANHIVGTHIERTEREFVTSDPFGEESRQRFTVYVHTRFRLATEAPGLEILNPPRSMQLMISQFAALTDFSLAVSAIVIDPLKWLQSIESEGRSVLARRVDFCDIAFGAGTHGTLRLDGENDVRAVGEKILGRRERIVRRVAALIRGGQLDTTWSVVVERDARAMIQALDPDDARDVLRTSLVRALG